MRKINTLSELKSEQKKLHFRKIFLESEIKNDLELIKADLEPLKLLTKSAGKILVSKDNGILGNSLGYIADILTKNILLKNSGFVTRLIVPYLVKLSTSNIVENNKSKIAEWAGRQISKLSKNKTAKI